MILQGDLMNLFREKQWKKRWEKIEPNQKGKWEGLLGKYSTLSDNLDALSGFVSTTLY